MMIFDTTQLVKEVLGMKIYLNTFNDIDIAFCFKWMHLSGILKKNQQIQTMNLVYATGIVFLFKQGVVIEKIRS